MLKWRSMEPTRGSYDWAEGTGSSARLPRAESGRPRSSGGPRSGWAVGPLARPPIGSAADKQAWQNFLKAAVARYGPGGSYWANGYREQFGADATPLPIQSWQIWNEPNLKKFFAPGANVQQSAQKYARLLQISHDAIKSRDPQAQIVLAGMPANGDVTAWVFLNNLYEVPGVKGDFDAAALHPYARDWMGSAARSMQFRASMTNHGDGPTPLWVTEFAWGSGPPDQFGKNKGLTGQQQLLSSSFKLILSRRSEWNLQRLFWFLWRDPPPVPVTRACAASAAPRGCCATTAPRSPPTTRSGASRPRRPRRWRASPRGRHGPHQGPDPRLLPYLERARLHLPVPLRCPGVLPVRLAVHSGLAARRRRPYLLRQGDRRPRKRERGPVAALHCRHRRPDGDDLRWSRGGLDLSDPDPSFDFTSNDPGASVSCQLDGGVFADCSSPFTASGLADGSHTFRVRATDIAQNTRVASRTWTVDTTPPTAWCFLRSR